MSVILKKVEKSLEIPSGYTSIDDNDLDMPFLMCIGKDNTSTSQLINSVGNYARVHVGDDDSRVKLNEYPVNFLYFNNEGESSVDDLVNNFLYPMLTKNGTDLESIYKSANKMNFITAFKGSDIFKEIEGKLSSKLQSLGFSEENLGQIFQRIFVCSIGCFYEKNPPMSNSVSYCDFQDNSINFEADKCKQRLEEYKSLGLFGKSHGNFVYLFNGNGSGNLDTYLSSDNYIIPAISLSLTKNLKMSIEGTDKASSDFLQSHICEHYTEDKTKDDLLSNIDSGISSDFPSYTSEGLDTQKIIDELCNRICHYNSHISQLIKFVKENSSDANYYKLLKLLGYDVDLNLPYFNFKSDREMLKHLSVYLSENTSGDNSNPKVYIKNTNN